jgi:hypothetical protein
MISYNARRRVHDWIGWQFFSQADIETFTHVKTNSDSFAGYSLSSMLQLHSLLVIFFEIRSVLLMAILITVLDTPIEMTKLRYKLIMSLIESL